MCIATHGSHSSRDTAIIVVVVEGRAYLGFVYVAFEFTSVVCEFTCLANVNVSLLFPEICITPQYGHRKAPRSIKRREVTSSCKCAE